LAIGPPYDGAIDVSQRSRRCVPRRPALHRFIGARPWRRGLGAAALLGGVAGGVLVAGVAAAPPAGAYPTSTVNFSGHGWGHGIGMGQWGALGYAVGQDGGAGNWTWSQIVTHYYAGTSLSALSGSQDATNVRIAMTENNGNNVVVTAPEGVEVPGGGTAAAVMFAASNGTWTVSTSAAQGCQGPWADPSYGLTNPSTSGVGGGTVTLCVTGGNVTMDGSVTATYNSAGAARTVNTLPLETYVADTVPGESPSSWATLGGPGPQGQYWGFQELEAQAVAVRSYVMSDLGGYGGYADTCDLECQTYRGTAYVTAVSIAAATDTKGMVMEEPDGDVAVTEYSASTGGYTTGAQFPIVVDAGDAICVPGACNPNHSWQASVPVSTIETDWPTIGSLSAINVTSRNGYGAWGGRVNSLEVVGTDGTVQLTGSEFSDTVGLNSDWFVVTSQPTGGISGYWLVGADGGIFNFGGAGFYGSMGGVTLVEPVVGMSPTHDDAGYWEAAADGGVFSFGDARFFGSMGGHPLNEPVVGMAPTPDGGGYWLVAGDGGVFSFGDARFFGSTGSLHLNAPVVGMAPTPDGGGYWLVAADGGIFSYGDAHFFGSAGSLVLNAPITGMAPTADGGGYWLVAGDGGVLTYGDAAFEGSASGTSDGPGTVALLPTTTSQGYVLLTASGHALNFGDAPQFGDLTTLFSSYSGHIVGGAASTG
jgi:SpoIID/LytB domain protein